jgi:hypothetical protein
MGVSVSTEILTMCQRHFSEDLFPYFYDRTTMDNYQSALAIERTGCCVTKMEYANSTAIGKNIVSFFILFIIGIHLLHEFVPYMYSFNN